MASVLKTQQQTATIRAIDYGGVAVPRPSAWFKTVRESGFAGVIRDCMDAPFEADMDSATSAGLSFMAFQGYWTPAWRQPGATRAMAAIGALHQAQYPLGATLWLDWESVDIDAPTAVVWLTNWGTAVNMHGYRPALWVGANQPLSGEQLWSIPSIHLYGRTVSTVPAVPNCGYSLCQTTEGAALAGEPVDMDTVGPDQLGRMPMWAVPDVVKTPAPAPASAPISVTVSAPGYGPVVAVLKPS